jgi:hypothetical protein
MMEGGAPRRLTSVLRSSAWEEARGARPSIGPVFLLSLDDERRLDPFEFAQGKTSLDMTNHLFGIARRIKSPSQSGFATPSRYARSDSTEEFTRKLL